MARWRAKVPHLTRVGWRGERMGGWLGDRDSNPDKQSQSLLSYR